MENWVVQRVRSVHQRQVIAWALSITGVLWILSLQQTYLTNFFMGPYEVGQAELDQITDLSTAPRVFVHVTGTEAIETGIEEITVKSRAGVETSRSVTAAYYVLRMGEKLLVIKSSQGQVTSIEGELKPLTAELNSNLFSDEESSALRPNFYDFYVDDDSYRFPGYMELILLAVFLIYLVWKGVPAWRYTQDPTSHPIVARVKRWGDLITLTREIKLEYEKPIAKGKQLKLCERYLFHDSFFKFDVHRYDDLVWSYYRIIQHRLNFIPLLKSYELVIHCVDGSVESRNAEKRVGELLLFLQGKAPWAIIGYSDELETAFTQNKDELIKAVVDRRVSGGASH